MSQIGVGSVEEIIHYHPPCHFFYARIKKSEAAPLSKNKKSEGCEIISGNVTVTFFWDSEDVFLTDFLRERRTTISNCTYSKY